MEALKGPFSSDKKEKLLKLEENMKKRHEEHGHGNGNGNGHGNGNGNK